MSESTWLATLGHFALGILCFGVFAFFFFFFASELRFTPLFRYLVLALAGGVALGFAIHHYSKSRRTIKIREKNGVLNSDANPGLLSEPTAISFMSISDSLAIPTTSKLKVPRGQ
ncbi:MAG: hypothetical protein ABL959_16410 [Pyrinomonadaceae bacterium]